MSEIKHTPGPWYHRRPTGFVGTVDDQYMIATVYGNREDCREDDIQIGNANLIAAAPDMLEALRECQSALAMMIAPEAIQQTTVVNAFASATAAEAKARAAIAKAEGRS